MCFSATISYSAAVILVATGAYAILPASRIGRRYRMLALVPLFFGIQQGFEGAVWQLIDAGDPDAARPYALGFHFFSHFLWLWWLPLASSLVEPGKIRKRLFLAVAIFGFLAGGMVYLTLLVNASWLSVAVENHHLVYEVSSPYRGPFSLGIPPSALYGLIILIPLLFSSYRHIRIFGVLVTTSMVLVSLVYGYAFVSVWCFFAAALSLYLVFMSRRLGQRSLTY